MQDAHSVSGLVLDTVRGVASRATFSSLSIQPAYGPGFGRCLATDPVRRWRVAVPRGGRYASLLAAALRSYVVVHLGRALSVPELAGALGVTERELRRAVGCVAGVRLAGFVSGVRLDVARAWLGSNREWRSQAELAEALGFRSGSVFGRAYQRRFGESVAETRQAAAAVDYAYGEIVPTMNINRSILYD